MIIEDERDVNEIDFNYDAIDESPLSMSNQRSTDLAQFIQTHYRIRDRETHSKLQADLVEHLWNVHGVE